MSAQIESGANDALPAHGRFQRRSLLASTAAFLAVAPNIGHAARTVRELGERKLTLEEFLAIANPLANELVGDTSPEGQDRYLLALAAVAVRLVDVPVPEMRTSKVDSGAHLGFNEGGERFNVLHWRLDPGAKIGDHAHSYGNVVTLLLDGEVRIRNFEVDGTRDYDSKESFRARRVCDQWVRTGGVNLVSLERNYTHGFVAGAKGARGLDLTTMLLERRPSPSLVLGKPLDEAAGLFEATWLVK